MHGILAISVPLATFNLLHDYGNVTEDQVEVMHAACMVAADVWAKQNAQMMYECLKNQ